MAVLYENYAFSIFNFLKKAFVFQKICFKVIVLKMFKISTDYHIKTYRCFKRKTIVKIPSVVFLEESMVFMLALK